MQMSTNASSIEAQLARQWMDPADVSTILLIIGGDVVQKAFAQGTGTFLVPICFSFGCIAYTFLGLVGLLGDGRLLPLPDYPCKVFNLTSGYVRQSNSFVLGRLLRDLEHAEARCNKDGGHAIRISIFEASQNQNSPSHFRHNLSHLICSFVIILQLGIACIPIALHGDWSVMLITAAGTLFVQLAGALPQWNAEKLPLRQKSRSVYALTSGNGSRDVIVIFGYGRCLDLESLATSQSPRHSRPWEKFTWLSTPPGPPDSKNTKQKRPQDSQSHARRKAWIYDSWPFKGFPVGFVISQVSYALLSILWLLLLINISISGNFPDSWCLLAIGGIGMFQNAWIAAKQIPPEQRNMPLTPIERIVASKVMDGIMDFHYTYDLGIPLRNEFFPGDLRPAESAWWNDCVEEYDEARLKDVGRTKPRSSDHSQRKFSYTAAKIRTSSTIRESQRYERSTFRIQPPLQEDVGHEVPFQAISEEMPNTSPIYKPLSEFDEQPMKERPSSEMSGKSDKTPRAGQGHKASPNPVSPGFETESLQERLGSETGSFQDDDDLDDDFPVLGRLISNSQSSDSGVQ